MAQRARLLVPVLLLVALSMIAIMGSRRAAAWADIGHIAVGMIAARHMDPVQLEKGNAIAKVLSVSGPYPLNPTMAELGPWPDDIRKMPITQTAQWHYIATTYIPQSDFKLQYDPVQDANVVTVIAMLRAALENPRTTAQIVGTALPWLIHLIGDIHNPVHNVRMYSHQYPDGDGGGALQLVVVDGGMWFPLHAYWDVLGRGLAGVTVPRPLNNESYKTMSDLVDYLEETYAHTLSAAEKANVNFTDISEFNYDLALKYAYPGADNGSTLSQEYKETMRNMTERHVLLAGYRLAKVLNESLKPLSMSTIMAGYNNIQSGVPKTDNSTVVNFYQQKGLSSGATAGIAVALFAVGVIAASLVVVLLCHCYNTLPKGHRYTEPDSSA